jgi:DNA-binding transcriptional LysR family regulator
MNLLTQLMHLSHETTPMKIDTLGVQAFIAIADRGSFQKAASMLHISQTALTRRLQNLEAALGIKLVERTTRSVALTNIGQSFLPQAKRLLGELSTALIEIRETGKVQRGDVCIASIPTVGVHLLPRIVQEYATRYPKNRIKILDLLPSDVTDAVLRREAEFGINVSESHHPELTSTVLLQDQLALACRDDHPLAKKKKLQWRQLEPYPLILVSHAISNGSPLDSALGAHHFNLQSYYEVQRCSTAIGMVAEGVAAAVVPRLSVHKREYPRVRLIALTDPVIPTKVVLVSRKAANLSPAAQALYDLIKKRTLAES